MIGHGVRRAAIVLCVALSVAACGTAQGPATTPKPRAVTLANGSGGAPQPPLIRVTRHLPASVAAGAPADTIGTSTDNDLAQRLSAALDALPRVSLTCGDAKACLENCPIDFGITYRVEFLDESGIVRQSATLDAQGCREVTLTPGGARRVTDPNSLIWGMLASILRIPSCAVTQPGVAANFPECHWRGTTEVPTRTP